MTAYCDHDLKPFQGPGFWHLCCTKCNYVPPEDESFIRRKINYDEMPAGKALDILVAEQVFGWTGIDKRWVAMGRSHATGWPEGDTSRGHADVPDYSKDIAAAWKVLEKTFINHGTVARLSSSGEWGCTIGRLGSVHDGRGDTAPLAICRAALKAARHDVIEGAKTYGQGNAKRG